MILVLRAPPGDVRHRRPGVGQVQTLNQVFRKGKKARQRSVIGRRPAVQNQILEQCLIISRMPGVLLQIHDRSFHGRFGIRPKGGADAGILASVKPDFLSEHFMEFRVVGPTDVLYDLAEIVDVAHQIWIIPAPLSVVPQAAQEGDGFFDKRFAQCRTGEFHGFAHIEMVCHNGAHRLQMRLFHRRYIDAFNLNIGTKGFGGTFKAAVIPEPEGEKSIAVIGAAIIAGEADALHCGADLSPGSFKGREKLLFAACGNNDLEIKVFAHPVNDFVSLGESRSTAKSEGEPSRPYLGDGLQDIGQ